MNVNVRNSGNSNGYRVLPVAVSGDKFVDFRPYVASVSAQGDVAFQALTKSGKTGIFVASTAAATRTIALSGDQISTFISHPDINSYGQVCFYGMTPSGDSGLFLRTNESIVAVALAQNGASTIGPLGPTMNESGDIAYRIEYCDGRQALCVARGGLSHTLADTTESWSGFEGLPVINDAGAVAFRANYRDGGHGIFLHEHQHARVVAETDHELQTLGRFPALSNSGTLTFATERVDGTSAIYSDKGGSRELVVDLSGEFSGFRGGLSSEAIPAVFYATTHRGGLGIYAGSKQAYEKVMATGDSLLGSTVTGLALNPVSINDLGQLAIRVELADGRQAIVRADP